jgi:hypothetical protein
MVSINEDLSQTETLFLYEKKVYVEKTRLRFFWLCFLITKSRYIFFYVDPDLIEGKEMS